MRNLVKTIAEALPGATLDQNFGPGTDSWKVGGKLFAIATEDGVSVKCPDRETAAMLVEIGQAEPAPYLGHAGWVRLRAADVAAGRLSADDIAHRLSVSHGTIVAALPKRLRPPGQP